MGIKYTNLSKQRGGKEEERKGAGGRKPD